MESQSIHHQQLNQQQKVYVNPLKLLYYETYQHTWTREDALTNNLTDTFWRTLKQKIDNGTIINIAGRGEVRTGKSTVCIAIQNQINQYIIKKGLNTPKNIGDISKFIFSDQTEFLRFINKGFWDTCIVIDEFNSLAETGANATTEAKLFDHYSDVFAMKRIHRITASPDVITDKNADVILDTIGKTEEGATRCLLTYRDIVTKNSLALGYVDIYVIDLIQNWLTYVKPIFEKQQQTLQEAQTIIDQATKDPYVKYVIKKARRMELLEKYAVRDIREPEFATIILMSLEELEDLAKMGRVNREIISITVDDMISKMGRFYSMVAKSEIQIKVSGLIAFLSQINRLNAIMKKPKTTNQEKHILQRAVTKLKKGLNERIKRQKQLEQIYAEYTKIR